VQFRNDWREICVLGMAIISIFRGVDSEKEFPHWKGHGYEIAGFVWW